MMISFTGIEKEKKNDFHVHFFPILKISKFALKTSKNELNSNAEDLMFGLHFKCTV